MCAPCTLRGISVDSDVDEDISWVLRREAEGPGKGTRSWRPTEHTERPCLKLNKHVPFVVVHTCNSRGKKIRRSRPVFPTG